MIYVKMKLINAGFSSRLFSFIIFFMLTAGNVIYSDDNPRKNLTKLVDNEYSNSKEVQVLYLQPEESRETSMLEAHIATVAQTLDKYGYYQMNHNLKLNVRNPSVKEIEDIIDYFINPLIQNSEVFALFTHGFESPRYGIAIAYYDDYSLRERVYGLISRTNKLLFRWLYKAKLPQSAISYGNSYVYTICLDTAHRLRLKDNFQSNGILYLGVCHGDHSKNHFQGHGTAVTYYGEDEPQAVKLAEGFEKLIRLMLGHSYESNTNSLGDYYLNTHEAFRVIKTRIPELSSSKGGLSIDPDSSDSNSARCLLRSPHIDRIKIFEGDKNRDNYVKFYNYEYSGKDKYNPTEIYPWDDYSSNIKPDKDQLKQRGSIKPIPFKKELTIEIQFSELMHEPVKVSFGKSLKRDENDFIIPGKLIVEKGNISTWRGKFTLSPEYSILNGLVNLHIEAEDIKRNNSINGLDKDGDGRYIKDDDGDFDNNHWFEVESPVEIRAMFLEGDVKGKDDYAVSYLVNGSNDRRMIGYAPSAERFNYVRAAGNSQATKETHLVTELKITGVTEKKKARKIIKDSLYINSSPVSNSHLNDLEKIGDKDSDEYRLKISLDSLRTRIWKQTFKSGKYTLSTSIGEPPGKDNIPETVKNGTI